MTRMIALALAAFTICLMSALAHAEQWHTARIKQIYPQADGNFVLIMEADSPSCTAGTPDYYNVFVGSNGMTQEGAKKIFATAALAFAMGKNVAFAFDESTVSCFINRLTVID